MLFIIRFALKKAQSDHKPITPLIVIDSRLFLFMTYANAMNVMRIYIRRKPAGYLINLLQEKDMKIAYYSSANPLSSDKIDGLARFLHRALEQYGDPEESIKKAIEYALDDPGKGRGGHVAMATENGKIIGAAVVNRTGMEGYIPENILVYIAVHHDFRGQKFGKRLLSSVIDETEGAIALHVEPDNPAFYLYRTMGFGNKYLEMRLDRRDS